MRTMKRRKLKLWKSRHGRCSEVAVEIESDGPVEIGAIDMSSGGSETRQRFVTRQVEGISEPYRDDGELRMGRVHEFGRGGVGASVMTNL